MVLRKLQPLALRCALAAAVVAPMVTASPAQADSAASSSAVGSAAPHSWAASSSAVGSSAAYQEAVAQLPTNPLLPIPVAHPGAPDPVPFGAERIARWYDSDISPYGPFYFHAVEPFGPLREHHPEVMEANLERVVEINNTASGNAALIERTLADDHDDLLVTMADAWGAELSGHFRTALAEGRLPKTTQLLGGDLGRGGGLSSTTGPEKAFFNFPRPFVVAPERITRFHRDGAEDEYSTSPAFPSGHTNQATWKSTLLAAMVPEIGLEMLARGSEVGFHRVVLGVHYPLDVIGGRMTGTAAAADRLNDAAFLALIHEAGEEIRAEMQWRCGADLAQCARPSDRTAAVSTFTERMDYQLPYTGERGAAMTVPDGAEGLLVTRFPELTAEQRREVLRLTAGPSGAPLDAPAGQASWQRLNLAAAWASDPYVDDSGVLALR